MTENAIGEELNRPQAELAEVYNRLLEILVAHEGELAPFERRNALKALAALWQVMNGLDMDPDQLYEVGA